MEQASGIGMPVGDVPGEEQAEHGPGPLPEESAGTTPAARTPAQLRERRRRTLTGVVLAATVLLSGVGGWWLRGVLAPQEQPTLSLHAVVNRPVTPLSAASTGTMPSIIGLSSAEAQRALFDAGLPVSRIATTQVPAAGTSGLVVTQNPAAGTDVSGGSYAAKLGVSVPAKVPTVAGRAGADAKAALTALGARVTVTQRYSPGASEGQVLSVSPKAGAVLPLTASLVVASPASAVYLDELNSIEGGCGDSDSVTANAKTYTHALTCQPGQDGPNVNSYVLNRKVARFAVTVGQDDTGQIGQTASVTFYGDRAKLRTVTVRFGQSKSVSVPVVGRLRLQIVARWVHPAQDAPGNPTLVLGNPCLIGAPSAIDALVAESGR